MHIASIYPCRASIAKRAGSSPVGADNQPCFLQLFLFVLQTKVGLTVGTEVDSWRSASFIRPWFSAMSPSRTPAFTRRMLRSAISHGSGSSRTDQPLLTSYLLNTISAMNFRSEGSSAVSRRAGRPRSAGPGKLHDQFRGPPRQWIRECRRRNVVVTNAIIGGPTSSITFRRSVPGGQSGADRREREPARSGGRRDGRALLIGRPRALASEYGLELAEKDGLVHPVFLGDVLM